MDSPWPTYYPLCLFPIEQPDPSIRAEVNRFADSLRNYLLPELRLFKTFEILFASPAALGEVCGRYRQYTCDSPLIWLNVTACCVEATQSSRAINEVLLRTTMEMLAFAIQEKCDLPLDSEQAEEFARCFLAGQVWEFWKRGRPVREHTPF